MTNLASRWHSQSASQDIHLFSTALKDWQQEYERVEQGEFNGNLQDVALDGVRLFRERMNLPVAQHVHLPEGLINVLIPLGVESPGTREQTQALSADCISLLPQNQDMYFVGSRNTDYLVISVDQTYLLERLCQDDQQALLDAQRCYSLMVSPQQIEQLRRQLPALLNDQLRLSSQLSVEAMQHRDRALQEQLLGLVCDLVTRYDAAGNEVKWRPLNKQHQYIVSQCQQFAVSPEGAEASILDVCRMLNIPRRTLNYSFQRVTGMSPVRYLRLMKLNCARREILTQDAPIGDIAARYGFFHVSYFGQEYRRLFGESPSQTRSSITRIPLCR